MPDFLFLAPKFLLMIMIIILISIVLPHLTLLDLIFHIDSISVSSYGLTMLFFLCHFFYINRISLLIYFTFLVNQCIYFSKLLRIPHSNLYILDHHYRIDKCYLLFNKSYLQSRTLFCLQGQKLIHLKHLIYLISLRQSF